MRLRGRPLTPQRLRGIVSKGPRHLWRVGRRYLSRYLQRVGGAWSPEAVTEVAFLRQLALPEVHAALQAGRLVQARRLAAAHFRQRTQPAFCFNPRELPAAAALLNIPARAATLAAADEVCRRTFRLRGQPPVTFTGQIDWLHRPGNNRDWTWELNRHAYFVTLGRAFAYTGEARYAQAFRDLMLDWLARNPPGVDHRNWDYVLEVAYRLNVWLWAYHYFLTALDDDALLACVRGLWLHGSFLLANLEYQSPNNHLLLESKALAMAGLLFPEFAAARRWRDDGLALFWRQLQEQVRPDGVHSEQATMYHQIIASELLELLVLLDANGQTAPPAAQAVFQRMVEFEAHVTKPDGEAPLLGDSSLGDSYVRFMAVAGGAAWLGRDDLPVAGLDEPTAWLLGPERARRAPARDAQPGLASRAFPHSGHFIMRHGSGRSAAYLVFDCGPFCDERVPSHGHADALSFELYAAGRTLVVDPGAFAYFLGDQWRNYFRGTAAHNTVTVDGLDQSELAGAWHVVRPARAALQEWVSQARFDFVDGWHDGYQRLREPVTHRRQIFFLKPEYWVVLDQLTGQGQHHFDLRYHFPADAVVTLDQDTPTARVQLEAGPGLVVCPLPDPALTARVMSGNVDPILGWVSRYSGEKTPAPTLQYSLSAPAPARFITLLYPCPRPGEARVTVTGLPVRDAVGQPLAPHEATGLRIEADGTTDLLIVDHRAAPGEKQCDGWVTNVRLAHRRVQADNKAGAAPILHGGARFERAPTTASHG